MIYFYNYQKEKKMENFNLYTRDILLITPENNHQFLILIKLTHECEQNGR